MAASTLPALLLGGDPAGADETYAAWRRRSAADRAGPGRRPDAALPAGRRRGGAVDTAAVSLVTPASEAHAAADRHAAPGVDDVPHRRRRAGRRAAGRLAARSTLRRRPDRRCTAGPSVFTPAPTSPTLPPGDADVEQRGRWPVRPARAPRPRAGCRCATARPRTCRSSCAARARASRQVNNFAAAEAFECDRLIGSRCSPRAATGRPTRRTSTTRTADEPSSRRSTTSRSPAAASAYQRVYGTATARSTCWPRCAPASRAGPARLARPVDGRARLRPVLPQRDGRARRPGLAVPRRPRRTPGSATPGRTSRSTRELPMRRRGGTHETHRRPGPGPVPAAQDTERDGVEQRFIAGLLRHLRPRQRRRHRPGAARAAPTTMPYYLARNEQAMVHAAAATPG